MGWKKCGGEKTMGGFFTIIPNIGMLFSPKKLEFFLIKNNKIFLIEKKVILLIERQKLKNPQFTEA